MENFNVEPNFAEGKGPHNIYFKFFFLVFRSLILFDRIIYRDFQFTKCYKTPLRATWYLHSSSPRYDEKKLNK